MLRLSSFVVMSLLGLMLTAALIGNENGRVALGTRAEALEIRIESEKARHKMAGLNLKDDIAPTAGEPVLAGGSGGQASAGMGLMPSTDSSKQAIANSMYYTTHPGAYHNLITISIFGDSVETEDGAIWTVSPDDSYTALNWFSSDAIVISPNHSWFSDYYFRMTNQNTGESIAVNLYLGPLFNSPYTHWIAAIDYYNNTVYLEDGSSWSMSYFDEGTVNKWLVNDTVIIGINDGWLSSTRPNILINVNMLNYAVGVASY